MWRFLCVLTALVPFSGAQSLIMTFGNDERDLYEYQYSSGVWYNIISNQDDEIVPFYSIPAESLKNTDGSLFEYALSVAPIDAGAAALSSFTGEASEVGEINEIFGSASINGVLSHNGETMLNIQKVKAGSYTLSVLAARGNRQLGEGYLTTYYLDCGASEACVVKASAIASHTSSISIFENSTKVKALTVNTSNMPNVAENWVLMQFDVVLFNDVKNLKLCAVGNYGNVAAIAFSVVPEPSSSLLSILALAVMVRWRRR